MIGWTCSKVKESVPLKITVPKQEKRKDLCSQPEDIIGWTCSKIKESVPPKITVLKQQNKQTPWSLVRERTIPTDRQPLVDEI
jgi:hypothetical protein